MDIAAMNAILDFTFGIDAHPDAPTSHSLALYYGDPRDGGVEITGGGYARVTVAAADWNPAADGQKATDQKQFPATTDAYSSSATHWGLLDGSTLWSSGEFVDPIVVTGAGNGPLVTAVVRWADSIIPDEG